MTDVMGVGTDQPQGVHATETCEARSASPPTPYYADQHVTLYHGDCRDLLPLPAIRGDAVLSDPPYGVEMDYGGTYRDTEAEWWALLDEVIPLMRKAAPFVVIPSCQILRIGEIYRRWSPDWLMCWHKGSPGTASKIGFNDWEPLLCWGRPQRPMHDHFYAQPVPFDNGHPCPKPTEFFAKLIGMSTTAGATVIDPFAGSGSMLRAAKNMGRKAIGIEREERFCEIIVRRMDQGVLDFGGVA